MTAEDVRMWVVRLALASRIRVTFAYKVLICMLKKAVDTVKKTECETKECGVLSNTM